MKLRIWWIVLICVCLFAATAMAQPAPPQPETPQPETPAPTTKPWAAGVPEPEQEIALAIYKEGNAEFEQARYQQALEKYREAIKHWEHPAIRFNMVVTTGAAAVLAGGVMVYLNRGKTVYESRDMQLGVVPIRNGAALGVSGRF